MELKPWRGNLFVIAIAEFLAVCGFSIINPFLPLYFRELWGFTTEDAALWSGIALGGSGLAMFLSAPVWGIVADRFGRKPMLLRAQFGAGIIVALFVLIPNVHIFVGLRILQGVFSGTVPAAVALVATVTPREKIPFAMGIIMGSVYAGNSFGPLIGGFLADNFGFNNTFIATSILLFIGGFIILLLTRENFQRPSKENRGSFRGMLRLAISPVLLPILIVIAALNLGPQMIAPVISLIIGEMNPGSDVATASGLAFALMGLVVSISSFAAARLNNLFSLKKLLVFCCICTGILYLPPIWAVSVAQMVIMLGLTGLFIGGLMMSSNSLISFSVPIVQQGMAYGLSQSAMALGRGLGPIIGGGLVPLFGLRPVFGVAAGVFILAGIFIASLAFRQTSPGIKPE